MRHIRIIKRVPCFESNYRHAFVIHAKPYSCISLCATHKNASLERDRGSSMATAARRVQVNFDRTDPGDVDRMQEEKGADLAQATDIGGFSSPCITSRHATHCGPTCGTVQMY